MIAMLVRRSAGRVTRNGQRNDQATIGHGAASFSSSRHFRNGRHLDRYPAVISRSLSTIQAGDDGADAVFTNVVGSQVTALA